MIIWLQIAAWLLAVAVAFSAVGPARYRPQLWITHYGEHALAFVLIGLAFAVAYPRHRPLVALILIVLICSLELLQLWMPGRHARWRDLVVDLLAALVGMGMIVIIDEFIRTR
jgi:VanZ family protein